jgi:hypothetical protein
LLCDLVGSTLLSAQLDPEDQRELPIQSGTARIFRVDLLQ